MPAPLAGVCIRVVARILIPNSPLGDVMTYPTGRMPPTARAATASVVAEPVPPRPGHDTQCERGRGTVAEECHCASRAYVLDREDLQPVDPPWGLFAWERTHPDTRRHQGQETRPWTPEAGPS